MVIKPGMPYLDVVRDQGRVPCPTFSLPGQRRIRHDQGRCRQWLARTTTRSVMEALLGFKRAGADKCV